MKRSSPPALARDTANILADACWIVLVQQFGDAAKILLPPSTRERLDNPSHHRHCTDTIRDLKINVKFAKRALGLEGILAL
ncbi:MAG: hypothetical protein ACK506_16345 [Pirellula sp.]|jgi:hypothetical protein